MSNSEKTLVGLKKAKGLIEKEIEMLEEGKYCIDIMQQNLAAIGVLRSVHALLMENHLRTCFWEALESGNKKKKEEMVQEILRVNSLFNH